MKKTSFAKTSWPTKKVRVDLGIDDLVEFLGIVAHLEPVRNVFLGFDYVRFVACSRKLPFFLLLCFRLGLQKLRALFHLLWRLRETKFMQ